MKDLEARFKKQTSLRDRSEYKIFYGQIRPGLVLALGKNPGGFPSGTSSDGCQNLIKGTKAAASASFYEGDENDLMDCDWPENEGLRKLLEPLFSGNAGKIRNEVVKTNVAFQRSPSISKDQKSFQKICAPYLEEIIGVVMPRLICLRAQTFPTSRPASASRASRSLMH